MVKKLRIKTILFVISIFIFIFFENVSSYFFDIVETATPSIYKIKLKNLYISPDGEDWIEMQVEPIEIDIASIEEEDIAKTESLVSTVPPGDYNKIEYSICSTFKMRGYINYEGKTYYTSTVAENSTGVADDFSPENLPQDYGTANITTFGYEEYEYFYPIKENINFKIRENVKKNIKIYVDVSNTLALYQTRADPNTYQLMPAEPEVTVFLQ